jgi:oligopeptide transport system permease protein
VTVQAPVAQPFDALSDSFHSKPRGLWEQALRRLVRNRLALASGIVLVVIAVVAFLGDLTNLVARHDPTEQQYACVNCEPAWLPPFLRAGEVPSLTNPGEVDDLNPPAPSEFWLGTDNLGRDSWARLLQGTAFSIKVGLAAQAVILLIGLLVGMTAAIAGRFSDTVLMWVTDLVYAFPDLLAIILFRQLLFGRDIPIIGDGDPQIPGFSGVLLATVLAIAFTSWVTVARLVRGQMLSIKEMDYTNAARCLGASEWRIIRVHMLPNTLGAIIVAVTFGIPLAIFAEAALSFIGLGVPAPDASLGSLISDGQSFIRVNQWMIIWPSLMVATLMLGFTFLGDGLRDALDPRTRK